MITSKDINNFSNKLKIKYNIHKMNLQVSINNNNNKNLIQIHKKIICKKIPTLI